MPCPYGVGNPAVSSPPLPSLIGLTCACQPLVKVTTRRWPRESTATLSTAGNFFAYSAAAVALPEVFLGIIPGWGGAYLLPNLIGIENALEVVISNPLKQNRMLKPQQAFE